MIKILPSWLKARTLALLLRLLEITPPPHTLWRSSTQPQKWFEPVFERYVANPRVQGPGSGYLGLSTSLGGS